MAWREGGMINIVTDASFHLKGGRIPSFTWDTHSSRAGYIPTRDRPEGPTHAEGDARTQMLITTSPRRRGDGEADQSSGWKGRGTSQDIFGRQVYRVR